MTADNQDLIPMGAPSSRFDVVMRGYDRNQVADEIGRLENDLRTIMAERDRAAGQATEMLGQIDRLQRENAELKESVANAQPPTFETMGGRIASMLRLAEEEAAEIRAAATKEAEELRASAEEERQQAQQQIASNRAEADQYAADRRAEADELLSTAKDEAAQHLESHQRQAEEELSTARADARRLTAESEAKRLEAEEDFEITLNARRSAAQQEQDLRERISLADAQQRMQESKATADELLRQSHADASRTIQEANEQSAAAVRAAQAEVHHLQTIRAALAQQVRGIGELIATVPADLAIEPEQLLDDREVVAPSAVEPDAPTLYSDDQLGAEDQQEHDTDVPEEPVGVMQSVEPHLADDGLHPEHDDDDAAAPEAVDAQVIGDEPGADASTDQSPTDESPAGEQPVDEASVDEASGDEAAADEILVDEEPAAEGPAAEAEVPEVPEADSADELVADVSDEQFDADDEVQDSVGGEVTSGEDAAAGEPDPEPVGSPAEQTVQLSAIRARRPRR